MEDFAIKKKWDIAWVSQIVNPIGDQFPDEIKTGWVIMSPCRGSDTVSALFTKTSTNDYENYPGIKRKSLQWWWLCIWKV